MAFIFEVKEIAQRWAPPFQKKIEEKKFSVQESEGFDSTTDTPEPVFKLIQSGNGKVLVEYRRDFTPKGYEQPAARQFWFGRDETREFSFLWGDHGVTKKLTYKGVGGENTSTTDAQKPVPTSDEDAMAQAFIREETPAEKPRNRIIEA